MKKYLLGTSALVAAGMMAGQANAADKLSLGVGGFIEEWFGYMDADQDSGTREWAPFGIMTDSEIHFKGTVNLDNGMKVTARVEVETNSDRQNMSIDEVWLQISSDTLGMIEIGEQDPVTDSMSKSWGGYGIGLGDADKWIRDTPGVLGESAESAKLTLGSEDQSKVSYYTPAAWQKATGLQAGFTYTPNNTNLNIEGSTNKITEGGDSYAFGLTYSQKLMGVDTYLVYGYMTERPFSAVATNNSTNVQKSSGHMVNANFKYGDWELGGGYVRQFDEAATSNSGSNQGYAYNFGLGYTMDKWQFSVDHMYLQGANRTGTGAATRGDTRRRVSMVDASYNLGGGIRWATSLFHQQLHSEEAADADRQTVGHGWGIVTGLAATF